MVLHRNPDTVYQFVRDELMATFVTTWREPQAERLMADICAALDRYQTDTGLDIPVHVDPDLVWDFRLPRVQSIADLLVGDLRRHINEPHRR